MKYDKNLNNESPLMTFTEFCDYLKIGETKARELIKKPLCSYVVRVGRRIYIHKKSLDVELEKAAKYRLTL